MSEHLQGLARCGLDHTRDDHGARQVGLTLPPRGTLTKLPGPWKKGWKAVAQRKAETADEFAVRCQEDIDDELVRAVPPIRATRQRHPRCPCVPPGATGSSRERCR